MLFWHYGVRPGRLLRRSTRRRGSARIAAVRVEILGDRILLSGPPVLAIRLLAPAMTALADEAGARSAASVRRPVHAVAEITQAGPKPSASEPGSTGIATQTSRASPAHSSSSAGSNAPGKSTDNSTTAPAGTVTAPFQPEAGCFSNAGSSSNTSAGQISASNSGAPSPVPPVFAPAVRTGLRMFSVIDAMSSAQPVMGQANAPVSIFVPSPIPPGVPVSGIFQQAVHGPSHGDAYGLSLDSIAVDSSSLAPVADVVHAFAPARRSVRVVLTGGPAPETSVDVGAPPPVPLAAAGRALSPMPDGTAAEVAELPDLAAAVPNSLAPSAEFSGTLESSPNNMSDHNRGEILAAQALWRERRLVVRVAAYGTVCLALGSSAARAIAVSRRSAERATGDPTSHSRDKHNRLCD
jgi:hypothetical protein